jgi:ABC-type antimicrobial peptide transport system permease subunit
MRLLNPIKISYKNLMAAKFRSFLTMLGIIIGVGSVILIMAIGQSAQELILDQVKGIGTNLIGVIPGASDDDNAPPAAAMGIAITTFTYDDLEALRSPGNVPEVEDGVGYVMGSATVSYNGYEDTISYTGVTASYINVETAEVKSGRFFTKEEEANLSKVAVVGSKMAEDFFGADDPVGKNIKIKDITFNIVGVFKERGSGGFGSSDQDESVFVPLRTGQKTLLGINYLSFARLKVKSPDLIPSAISNAKTTLRDRHHIKDSSKDDFSVRDQASALKTITNITNILRYFLLAIGTVSLIVGGVGIMNVMLIAVNQRIKEVGLRKAIGARNSEITSQFLIESATIASLGGFVGIILGIFLSFIASIVVQALGYYWPFLISIPSIFIAFGVSVLIGIIFGLYPARKASKISPMEALRYE